MSELNMKEFVGSYVERARVAQKEFETWSQERVDEAVRAIGKAVYDNAEEISELAVKETGMGKYEDKIQKNTGKPKVVWQKLKNVKSRNIIKYIEEENMVEIAKPVGVVAAVTPATNPTMTPAQNAMIALKGGNSIIVSPHPRGKKSGALTVNYMREALKAVGAPEDLIQIIPEPSNELTQTVMSMCDVVVAAGGKSIVGAAYSSGKPSYGVGPGNNQCVVDKDVKVEEYIDMVVRGRTYDNGILCTCEQTLIVPREQLNDVIAALKDRGGYHVEGQDVDKFRDALFPNKAINPKVIGRPAHEIGEITGIDVPKDKDFIFVISDKYGEEELFSKEKLCVVLNVVAYDEFDEATNIAKTNLEYEGEGHSAVIHSHTKENIEKFSVTLNVSRVVVNQQGSNGLGGALYNGLNPTGTLGCGSWGNNSISENLWWTHLVNISRLAYVKEDAKIPTDEEIWN